METPQGDGPTEAPAPVGTPPQITRFDWQTFVTTRDADGSVMVGLKLNTVTGFTVVFFTPDEFEALPHAAARTLEEARTAEALRLITIADEAARAVEQET